MGDFVLSGGEIAAFALVDACVRLLPGVMNKAESAAEESFSARLLEYPQYTRPQLFEGRTIPDILISGDHAKVAAWRRAEAEAALRGKTADESVFGQAADLAVREAKGFRHNEFKIDLARRTIIRALLQAARGTPQSQSNKKIA